MRIANESLQDSATSMGSSFELRAVYLGHICNYSIQLVFTGTPGGTFKLQCSNDPGLPNASFDEDRGVTNWTDITGTAVVISAAGDLTWNVENAGYPWVRVVYTFSSGSGSLTSARANVKGV
jgi:hypothetical protein